MRKHTQVFFSSFKSGVWYQDQGWGSGGSQALAREESTQHDDNDMVVEGSIWLGCPEKNLKCLIEFHRKMIMHWVSLLVSMCSWLCVFPRTLKSFLFQAVLVYGLEASICRQILVKEEGLTVATCFGYEDVVANLSLSTVLQKEAGGHNYCGVLTGLSAQVALVQ